MNRYLNIFGAALLSVALMGCNHSAASNAAAAANADQNGSKKGLLGSLFETKKQITIPEGSPFEVTLDETLTSNRNHAGDLFAASLSEPIVEDGKTIIPAGAHVAGRVVDAKDAGRLHVPARLSVALSSVEVDGKSYDIDTGTIRKTGQNHNKRNLGFIGGGAAGGAIIGALAGGGKGALIGSAVGAGAGTAGAAATGKKDVSLPAETRLRFYLLRSVTVTVKG
jgi:outer membrane lipoprotein SlyB